VSDDARLDALRGMVEADPGDLFARLLLGRELLTHGEHAEAVEHLAVYLDRESADADSGAAYGALAEALAALGRRQDALTALAAGIANARAHRHLGLAATLEEQREALAD
jgi:predicted Zn-dependent protease